MVGYIVAIVYYNAAEYTKIVVEYIVIVANYTMTEYTSVSMEYFSSVVTPPPS